MARSTIGSRDDWDAQYLTNAALLTELERVQAELVEEQKRLRTRWAAEGRPEPTELAFVTRPVEGPTLLQIQQLLGDRLRHDLRRERRAEQGQETWRQRLRDDLRSHTEREMAQRLAARTRWAVLAGIGIGGLLAWLLPR